MKKIALVSTYHIDCGIARFAEILESSITDAEITVFPLHRNELKESFGGTQKSANKFITNLVENLKNFDAVCIQYEYSLLSDSTSESTKRLIQIIQANPNTTVTFHTIYNKTAKPKSSGALKSFLKLNFKESVRRLLHHRTAYTGHSLEENLFKKLAMIETKIIVHTQSSTSLLKNNFQLKKVFSHPLSYTSEADKEKYNHNTCKANILHKLGLEDDSYLIGVFGFLGDYKGFDYAIDTLNLLDKKYKLLICGGLHPSAIKLNNTTDVNTLLNKIKLNKELIKNQIPLRERVFFLGSLEDDEMYETIAAMDMCWLPYREVGQEASAIASEVSELGKRVILARTNTFEEYRKFKMRNDTLFFEIGNTAELRLKTLRYDEMTEKQHLENTAKITNHLHMQSSFYLQILLNE